MALSSDLISQFVDVVNTKKEKKEITLRGTVKKIVDGKTYVHLDGAPKELLIPDGDLKELLTPVSTTAEVKVDDKVTVLIKDHAATITGNLTSPSARTGTVTELGGKITKVETLVGDRATINDLQVERGRIEELKASVGEIRELTANVGQIDTLISDNVQIKEKLTAAEADIETLETTKLDAKTASATYATIKNLEITNGKVYNLEATYGEIHELTAQRLEAVEADITRLDTDKLDASVAEITYAKIEELNASNADIGNLEADIADINTLIFGVAAGDTIQASFANAVIAQLGNAQIKSAMIESIAANKIISGDIITNNVHVKSEDGKLLISDETIQISDDTRVRVQIGKDGAGDYSISIWDADGKLMFSEGGITDSAIKNAIIRDDMVSDTANISAHKLDVVSLFEVINGSTNTINSTRVYLDTEGQTLDLAFKSLSTEVGDLEDTVSSQGTQISAIQGQIASKIWKNDIDNVSGTMTTRYSEVKQEVDDVSIAVVNHTSELIKKADSTEVTELNNRMTSVEATLSGFQSTVSTTYATKTAVDSIEIGGRNLLLNTGNNELPVMCNDADPTYSGGVRSAVNSDGELTLNCNTTAHEVYYRFMIPVDSVNNLYGLELGKSYTFSGKAKVNTTSGTLVKFITRVQYNDSGKGWADDANNTIITTEDTDDWVSFVSTFTVDESATGCFVSVQLYFDTSWVGVIKIKELQLEYGNKATAWSPAPEDYPTVASVTAAQASADAAQDSIDNLTIGGRNLLLNTREFKGSNISAGSASLSEETYKGLKVRTKDNTSVSDRYSDMVTFINVYADKLGEEYTLSYYAKGSGTLTTYFYGPEGYIRVAKGVQSDGSVRSSPDGASPVPLTDTWARHWVTWTLASEGDLNISKWVLFRISAGGKADVCGVKLEKGAKATDWTPAPEDVDTDIAAAQAAADAAQAAANRNAADMASVVTDLNRDIANLQTQIDGSITTWFYGVEPTANNEPAVNWTTTDDKNVHLGDLYYDTITGYCYRYQVKNNIYSWQRITDTDVTKALSDARAAKDTADQKRRVFYSQPTTPYDAGDLWVQGSGGDILRCQTSKANGQSYALSDWVAASKYTDDTTANSALSKANSAQQTANTAVSDLANLRIGGRNLLVNSKGDDIEGWVYPNVTVVDDDVKGKCVRQINVTPATENYIGSTRTKAVEPATEYTFSADVWINEYAKPFELFWLSDTKNDQKSGSNYVNVLPRGMRTIDPNKWTRVTWTFTTNPDDYTGYIRIDNNGTSVEGEESIIRVANLKLEKGNRATDWTPAPEDLEDRVTTVETKIIQNDKSITSLANRTTTVENKFAGYSTTEQMNSAITQSANSITSSVSETYTTKTEFNNLSIGGRNLIAGTNETTEYVGNATGQSTGYKDIWTGKTIAIPTEREYIVSFDAKADVAQNISCFFYSPNTTLTSTSSTGYYKTGATDGNCQVSITTEWARYWVKWTQDPATALKSVIVGRNNTSNNIYIRAVKLEAGSKATDWTPAPEDMATLDNLESVQSSSDMIEARMSTAETLIEQLTDAISMLVTDSNGESLMTQTSTGWTFSTSQIQSIVDDTSENLDSLTNEVGDVKSVVNYLRQAVADLGILSEYVKIGTYEDEPCIELGESDSDFKLLITNTRIMFMEGSGVPAYINNQSLYIKKAVIEEELQQGEFVWKMRSNGNLGLVWKGVNS